MKKKMFSKITAFVLSWTVIAANLPTVDAVSDDVKLTEITPSTGSSDTNAEKAPELETLTLVEGDTSASGYTPAKFVDENGDEFIPDLIPTKGNRAVSLPASYDIRDNGWVAKEVRDQDETGTCWAFSGLCAAESNMIINGYADSSVDLSEAHLVWFGKCQYSTDSKDPLYHEGDNLGNAGYDKGGNIYDIISTLGRGIGVEYEKDYPAVTERPSISESKRYLSKGRLVQSELIAKTDRESAKLHLMNTGALSVAYAAEGKYLSKDETAYYCPSKLETNHMVTVVGWDDNYSKSNFTGSSKPSNNGAWICRNSWGDDDGLDGYFYLSYYDASMTTLNSIEIVPPENYTKTYQYTTKMNSAKKITGSGLIAANTFEADENETLKAISISNYTADMPYTISIYKNAVIGSPDSGELVYTQDGTAEYAGYHIIELDEPVSIEGGTGFKVAVTMKKNGAAMHCDEAVTKEGAASYATYNVTTKKRSDWGIMDDGEFCIQAFTEKNIPIDIYKFPDKLFRQYILDNIDKNGDGNLSSSEIAATTSIDVSKMKILDLTGIEYFTSLTSLNCSETSLVWIDLSKNTNLQVLNTKNAGLSLSTIFCDSIDILYFDHSKITSITGAEITKDHIIPTGKTVTYTYKCSDTVEGTFTVKGETFMHAGYEYEEIDDNTHTVTCDHCGYTFTEDHRMSDWQHDGDVHYKYCYDCEYKFPEKHSLTDWEPYDESRHARHCTICGQMSYSPHSFAEWTVDDHDIVYRMCSVCNDVQVLPGDTVKGDMDLDGIIDAFDLSLMMSGLQMYIRLKPVQQYAADVNSDGVFNIADIVVLKKYLLRQTSLK